MFKKVTFVEFLISLNLIAASLNDFIKCIMSDIPQVHFRYWTFLHAVCLIFKNRIIELIYSLLSSTLLHNCTRINETQNFCYPIWIQKVTYKCGEWPTSRKNIYCHTQFVREFAVYSSIYITYNAFVLFSSKWKI